MSHRNHKTLASETNPQIASFDPSKMAAAGTHEVVRSLLSPPTGGRVLDVGAGEGAFTQWLHQAGYRPIAVGIMADQYRYERAPFVCANVDQGLPIASATVDGIVAIELVEHLEQPIRLLHEASRCLVPGGWLILTTPNVLSLGSKLSLVLRNYPIHFGPSDYRDNGHISPLSRIELERGATRAGLSIEAITYNVGKLPIPRLRHRFVLRAPIFRNELWGETLIIRMRKLAEPPAQFTRG